MEKKKVTGSCLVLKDTYISLILLTAVFTAYWGLNQAGFIRFDDPSYIINNPIVNNGLTVDGIIKAFTGFHSANWHPVTWVSHMIDVELFGMHAPAQHLVSILIHVLNSILLFFVLKVYTGRKVLSFAASIIFAVHPVNVESVAWISQRKTLLTMFFALFALLSYHSYAIRGKKTGYLFAVLFFMAGLASKQIIVCLPLLMFALDFWPLERMNGGKDWKNSLKPLVYEKLPFIVTALTVTLAAFLAQRSGGAVAGLDSELFSIYSRIANAFTAVLMYIWKTVFPFNLAVYYPHTGMPHFWKISLSFLIIFTVSIYALILNKNHPWMFTGWSWFILAILPVLGIVQIGGQSMALRYMYCALPGLALVIVWEMDYLLRRWKWGRSAGCVIIIVTVVFFMALTRENTGYWQNSETLFKHTLDLTKDNYFVHNLLGKVYYNKKQYLKADQEFGASLKAEERFHHAHYNRGLALYNMGRLDEAAREMKQTLKYMKGSTSKYPSVADIYQVLGRINRRKGDYKMSLEYLRKALEKAPSMPYLFVDIGRVYFEEGQYLEAEKYFRKSVELSGSLISGYIYLAKAYSKLGMKGPASECLDKARDLDMKRRKMDEK